MMGIIVKDMATSLAFYRLLGLEFPEGAEDQGHVEVLTPHGFRIAWDTLDVIKRFNETWNENPTGHRMGFAFLCESPAEVDDLHQKVVDAGYASHKPPWDAFWGQRYAVVVDPDGNLIDLFAEL